MAQVDHGNAVSASNPAKRVKLTGRAFYESIGSPKMIVAPMVDRSEFAWRLLTRSYLDESRSKELLAYTPMLHARLFGEQAKVRDSHFQPVKGGLASKEESDKPLFLDGNPETDRPLFVQFCANKPDELLEAAQYVAPYCDAVDLNLGCPQGIAKAGHYGAFLQEDWDAIHNMIRRLRDDLPVPVTAKMRVLDTKEKTLEYAQMILSAGASILTVHGRRREQKSHNTGVADWAMIRYLRDNLPADTVLFANGNILNRDDVKPCLEATGADGVMSAEGNLSDPTIFAKPPLDQNSREYWRHPTNPQIGGYRIDGVFRRYLDILYRHVLEQEPPHRQPLYVPGDSQTQTEDPNATEPPSIELAEKPFSLTNGQTNGTTKTKANIRTDEPERPSKKQKKNNFNNKKRDLAAVHNPNLKPVQGHLFQMLRALIPTHVHIRDALARSRTGDMAAFENVLRLVEEATRIGLDKEHAQYSNIETTAIQSSDTQEESKQSQPQAQAGEHRNEHGNGETVDSSMTTSTDVRERCRRPFWVCQPYIRPLPEEAYKKGAMSLSKKEKEKLLAQEEAEVEAENKKQETSGPNIATNETVTSGTEKPDQVDPKSQAAVMGSLSADASKSTTNSNPRVEAREEAGDTKDNGKRDGSTVYDEVPKQEALACG